MEHIVVMTQCSQFHSLHLGIYHKPCSPAKNNQIVAVERGSFFELVRKALCKACVAHYKEGRAGNTQRGAAPVSNHSKESRHKARHEKAGEC